VIALIVRVERQSKAIKIALVAIAWVLFSCMFYLGIISSYFVGHLELSIIVSFALVFFSMHLFSILKKAALDYL
jgi:hypothetical protein